MLKYKLTTQDNTTYNNTKWEIGKTIEADGKIKLLCTNSWLHFYHTAELAVLLNPIHANIENPRLYECEVEGEILVDDYGLKAGCTKMALIREIEKPVFTDKQLVSISLEFVKHCFEYNNEKIKPVAQKCIDLVEKWLIDPNSVTEKELRDAYNAAWSASNAFNAASYAASYAAANASYAAANASYAAAYTAYTAYAAAYTAYAALSVSYAVYYSALVSKTDYIKLQEIINQGTQNVKV